MSALCEQHGELWAVPVRHLFLHIVISAGQSWLYYSRPLFVEKADIRRRCDKNALKKIIEYYLVFGTSLLYLSVFYHSRVLYSVFL